MAAQIKIQVPATNGQALYTITQARDGQSWYCSCPAWRHQRVSPTRRTCKHIDRLTANLVAYATTAERRGVPVPRQVHRASV